MTTFQTIQQEDERYDAAANFNGEKLACSGIVDQEDGGEGIDERCNRIFLSCREDWLHRETLPKGLVDPMVSVPGGLLISGSRSCLTYTT
jgi:hypothetical protein